MLFRSLKSKYLVKHTYIRIHYSFTTLTTMKKILILSLIVVSNSLFAQLPEHLEGKMTYPVFDFHEWVGVAKTKAKALKYDKDLDYKIVVDVTDKVSDSTKVMSTLLEVARTYNLNIANGVPKRKLKMAVVVHGGAFYGILNDEAYQEKYGTTNPNLEAIKIMKKEGVEFYVCSQILSFRNTPPENISKDIEIAVSAKTALITLDQMGYTYMNVNN